MVSLSSHHRPNAQTAINDVLGGTAASVLTITYGLSYALLIFAGPLASYLSYGVAATFIASAVLAAVIALGSSFRFAVAGPETSTAAMTGILASSLAERMMETGPSVPPLAPVLITLAVATIVTGVVLCAFGISRMGRAIRYVPYPVVGGFLGATAVLILSGAIRVITGQRLTFTTLGRFADVTTLSELAAACAMAMILYLTWHRSRNPFALPVILVGGVLVAHAAFLAAGLTPEQAQLSGWTFQAPPRVSYMSPWSVEAIKGYPWHALPDLIGNLIAVVFVTATSTLFNTAGIEVAAHHEADLERELNVTGIANILSGAFGGYPGCISVSRTMLNQSSGGTSPLSGLTVAAISIVMLVAAPALLGYMPKFVLGGLLIYLGADLLHKWIVESRRRLATLDYLSLLAIIVIIVEWGFVPGVLIGTVIGCATFALTASRIDSIKFGFDGSEYRSSLDRSLDDQMTLTAHGREILGLNLQSYLFFGSANRLYQHVKTLLHSHPECRYLVFDFKLVTGIDSSAAHSFAQIKRAAQERDIHLLLVNLSAAALKNLRASGFVSEDVRIMDELDHALEWCENEVIGRHRGLEQEETTLREWFVKILRTDEDADELMRRCLRTEFSAGDIIVNAGDAADSMHFILEGRVGIMVPTGDERSTRVRSLGRYTTVGEMGLVTGAPRSATIQAEVDSVLYVLRGDDFADIQADHPALGQKLLTYFVSVMAERLAFASRMIAALRR